MLEERKCILCEKNDIGDEFHNLLMQSIQIRKKELFNTLVFFYIFGWVVIEGIIAYRFGVHTLHYENMPIQIY